MLLGVPISTVIWGDFSILTVFDRLKLKFSNKCLLKDISYLNYRKGNYSHF